MAIVEDSILFAWDVLLQNHGERRVRQILVQLLQRTDDSNARTTLPSIRLQHDRKLQSMLPHEFLGFSKALGGYSTCQKSGTRQPLGGVLQLLQDLMLGL